MARAQERRRPLHGHCGAVRPIQGREQAVQDRKVASACPAMVGRLPAEIRISPHNTRKCDMDGETFPGAATANTVRHVRRRRGRSLATHEISLTQGQTSNCRIASRRPAFDSLFCNLRSDPDPGAPRGPGVFLTRITAGPCWSEKIQFRTSGFLISVLPCFSVRNQCLKVPSGRKARTSPLR